MAQQSVRRRFAQRKSADDIRYRSPSPQPLKRLTSDQDRSRACLSPLTRNAFCIALRERAAYGHRLRRLLFICRRQRFGSAPGNFSKANRGILVTTVVNSWLKSTRASSATCDVVLRVRRAYSQRLVWRRTLAIGNPVAFEANADAARHARVHLDHGRCDPSPGRSRTGSSSRRTRPISRMMRIEALRSAWYSRSVSVCDGATVTSHRCARPSGRGSRSSR